MGVWGVTPTLQILSTREYTERLKMCPQGHHWYMKAILPAAVRHQPQVPPDQDVSLSPTVNAGRKGPRGSPAKPFFPVFPLWAQVEVKPYVLDDQMCDECQGTRCGGKFAPFFCANVTCLQYYCEYCWASIHSRAGREFHKPLVKEGGDRPRHVPFRWS